MRLGGAVIFLMLALITLGVLGYFSVDSFQIITEQKQTIEDYEARILYLENEINTLRNQLSETSGYADNLENEIRTVTSTNVGLANQLNYCDFLLKNDYADLNLYQQVSAVLASISYFDQDHNRVKQSGVFQFHRNPAALVQLVVFFLLSAVIGLGVISFRKLLKDSRDIVQIRVTRREADHIAAMRRKK